MYFNYSLLLILALFITCNKTESFDKVELLKSNLLKYGFQPDTAFNKYREYSWKLIKDNEDSILVREAEFFLIDTICYDNFCRHVKLLCLHLIEYQLFPEEWGEYTKEEFPSFYERDRKRGLFFDKFSNYRKGLRHLKADRKNEFQRRVVLHNRYILLIAKIEESPFSDTMLVIDILNQLQAGILEQRNAEAQLKYSLLKANEIIKRNLAAHCWYSENVNNADTNTPPMEMENDLLHQGAVFNEKQHCRCLDVCTKDDGCLQGGYIYLNVLNADGSPAVAAECILSNSRKERFKNITDSYGCVGWCRIEKDEFMVDIFNKNEKKRVVPSWDTIPKIKLVKF